MCGVLVISKLGNLFSHEWVAQYMPPGTKAMADKLVDAIYTQIGNIIQDQAWLDAPTKAAALAKYALIVKNVAAPSSWRQAVDLTFTGHAFDDARTATRWDSDFKTNMVGHDVDRKGFAEVGGNADLMQQNAFYFPQKNSINMLPGLMLYPMFAARQPLMLNLAMYGYVIGHECTHGFDNHGRLYNGTGAVEGWWSDGSLAAFDAKTQCLVSQYDAYKWFGIAVHGAQTLGENIADHGGVDAAWRAYQAVAKEDAALIDGMTNDQLFWTRLGQTWCQASSEAFAQYQIDKDVHSPGRFRIIGPLSNHPAYAGAFKCGKDSPMGRSLTSERCQMW